MKKIIPILLGVVAVSIAARITIEVPVGEGIPISGQSLAVLLVGWYLGPQKGFIAILAYIVLGGFGLPIFADGNSGWSVLQKGSGGFLLGFILAAVLSGYFSQQKNALLNQAFNAMFFGTLLIIVFGVAWLTRLYGWELALEYGFFPFWPGAVVKIILGILIIFSIDRILER